MNQQLHKLSISFKIVEGKFINVYMSCFNNFEFCNATEDLGYKITVFLLLFKAQTQKIEIWKKEYRKVESSRPSWLVAHFQIFRRLMKGKFDAYVL